MIPRAAVAAACVAGLVHGSAAGSGFVPDDPLFPADAKGGGQWYLARAGFPEAWSGGLTGNGVRIGVVDNRFGKPSEDLAASLGDDPDDVSFGLAVPEEEEENASDAQARWVHGMLVSGLAAARGGNGIGICGAAPRADLTWIRLGRHSSAGLLDAIEYGADGARRVQVKNFSIGPSAPYFGAEDQGATRRAFRESADAGMLHVVAAGNYDGDCGKSLLASSPHVLVVGGCGPDGRVADWSASGGSVVASVDVAPPDGRPPGMIAIGEAVGDGSPFTTEFGGTSAAAPLVSGMLALAREADPALTVRAAKHLLARTCRPAAGEDVPANAAGVRHSRHTGFGRIDAAKFVDAARRGIAPGPLILEPDRTRDDDLGFAVTRVGEPVPDGDPAGLTRTFAVEGATPLEEVEIYLHVAHPRRGDIAVRLKSPAGTEREIATADFTDRGGDLRWIFVSHAFWGESPHGKWELTVVDAAPGESGELREFGWRMRMGTFDASPPPPADAR